LNQGEAVDFLLQLEGKSRAERGLGFLELDLYRECAMHGVRAYRAELDPAALSGVTLPVLFGLKDGGWNVIMANGKGWADIFDGVERWRVSTEELGTLASGEAVCVLRSFDWRQWAPWAAIRLAFREKRMVIPLALLGLGIQGVMMATSWEVANIIGDGAGSKGPGLGFGLAILAGMAAIQFALMTTFQRLYARFARSVRAMVNAEVVWRYLELPFVAVIKIGGGEILNATVISVTLGDNLGSITVDLWLEILKVILGLVAVTAAVPLMGVALTLFVIVSLGLSAILSRLRAAGVANAHQKLADHRQCLMESLAGAVTVKAQGIEGLMISRWLPKMKAEVEAWWRCDLGKAFHEIILTMTTRIFGIVVLAFGAAFVVRGKVDFGTLIFLIQACALISWGVDRVAKAIPSTTMESGEIAKKLEAVVGGGREPGTFVQGSQKEVTGAIAMRDVWFRYPGPCEWILKGATFEVEPGGKHWLKDPSGSGKTTTLRLLAGFLDPVRGEVVIDGQHPTLSRSEITYLPQFISLFPGSLLNNLQMLSGVKDPEVLMEMSKQTGLHANFVEALPMGYGTLIASETVSGGQRQLIGLTAALASRRKILLLDEAMANLDWALRGRIAKLEAFRGRTIVYAGHDRFL
jgi:ABC-type bacteriocin/lantibiotic exporter with double-glycine peptidase domain